MQLQELKKELDQCRIDLSNCARLMEKREIKIQRIHELKESVEANLIQMHTLAEANTEKADQIKQQISEETEAISDLKKAVQEIDHQLDQIGEEKEKTLLQLKKKLVDTIKTQFPVATAEYTQLEKGLAEAHKKESEFTEQKKQLAPLFEILYEGAQVKLKGGLFNFLLGSHPKAVLAQTIQKALKLAKPISSSIKDERFIRFLKRFIYEAEKPWNKELYKGKYSELFIEFSTLMTELEQDITQTHRLILETEQAIEVWIERHCSDPLHTR